MILCLLKFENGQKILKNMKDWTEQKRLHRNEIEFCCMLVFLKQKQNWNEIEQNRNEREMEVKWKTN